jgi:hypothetical protein
MAEAGGSSIVCPFFKLQLYQSLLSLPLLACADAQARVYPNVNETLGRSWWDYGASPLLRRPGLIE